MRQRESSTPPIFKLSFSNTTISTRLWMVATFDNVRVEVVPNEPLNPSRELLYEDSFTSIDSSRWILSSTGYGRIQAASGELKMDSTQYGSYALNEAILHLNLEGRTGVKMQFDHDNTGDENHSMPAEFSGSHNGDGVAISEDGVTWHRLTSLTDDFTGGEFDLDRAVALAGISYARDFQIKFQQYDNYPAPIDGRSIDNVRVTADRVNHRPEAVADSYTVDEDDRLFIGAAQGVLANDTDPDRELISALIHQSTQHGKLIVHSDGAFEYLPHADWYGIDRFSYFAFDGISMSEPVDVIIDVRPVNDAPTNLELSNQSVLEGVAGATVGKLSVADPDILDVSHTFNSSDGRFEVVDGLLKLKNFVELDSSFEPNVALTVEATDSGGQSFQRTFHIDVMPIQKEWRWKIQQGASIALDYATTNNNLADRGWMLPFDNAKLVRIDARIIGPLGASPASLSITQPSRSTSFVGPILPGVFFPTFGPSINVGNLSGIGTATESPGRLQITANSSFLGTFEVELTLQHQSGSGVQTGSLIPALQSTTRVLRFEVTPASLDTAQAIPDRYVSAEDLVFLVPAGAGVTANDSLSSTEHNVQLISAPDHGLVRLNSDGSFVYTPHPNFHGIDRFVYEAFDAGVSIGRAVVELQVREVNDAPSSWEDSYETDEDTSLIVAAGDGLLDNDEDVDGDPMQVLVVDAPSHGTVELSADGSFMYTPNPDFHGVDEFTYQSTDGHLSSEPTRVTLIVYAINDAPQAKGETLEIIEDSQFILPVSILANDSDADKDRLTVRLLEGPGYGILELDDQGNAVYEPQTDYFGPDHFVYVVSDGNLESTPVTATINVLPANDRPVARPDQYYVDGSSLTVSMDRGLLINDYDVDGDRLQASIAQAPEHGTVEINGDGSFVYKPEPGFQGTDFFVYVTTDGVGGMNYGSVALDVGVWGALSTGISDVLGDWSNSILELMRPAFADTVAQTGNTLDTLSSGISQIFSQNIIYSGKAAGLISDIASKIKDNTFYTPSALQDFVVNEIKNRLTNPAEYHLPFTSFPAGIVSQIDSLVGQIRSIKVPNASEIQDQIVSGVASHLNDMADRVQSVLDDVSNSLSSIGQTINRVFELTNVSNAHVDYAKRNSAFEENGSYLDEVWKEMRRLAGGPLSDLKQLREKVDSAAQRVFDAFQSAANAGIRKADRDLEVIKAGLDLKYPKLFGKRPPQYGIELAAAEAAATATRSAIEQALEADLKNWAVETVVEKMREQLSNIKGRLELAAKSAAEYVNPWSLGQSLLPSLKTSVLNWIANNPLSEYRNNLSTEFRRISGDYDSSIQGFRGGIVGDLRNFKSQLVGNSMTDIPQSITAGMKSIEQAMTGMSWPQTSIQGSALPSLPAGFAQALPDLRKQFGGIANFNRSITGLSSDILDPEMIDPWEGYRNQTRTVPSPPGVPDFVTGWLQGRVDAAFAELDRQGVIAGSNLTKWMESVHDFIDLRQQELQDAIDWIVDRHHEVLDAANKAIDHLRGIDWDDWRSIDGWYAEIGEYGIRTSKIGEEPTYDISFRFWGNTHDLSKVIVTVNETDRHEFVPNGKKHVKLTLPLKSTGTDRFLVETVQDGKTRRREEFEISFPIYVPYDAIPDYNRIAERHAEVSWFDGGTIRIDGTQQDDQVTISIDGDTLMVSMSLRDEIYKKTYRSDRVTRIEFYGNDGNDTLDNRTHIPVFANGNRGNDTIHGGSARDEIFSEWAYGGAGDDELTGTHLYGEEDHDTLHGTSGDDQLFGGAGRDWIDGAGGNDFIDGGTEDDIIYTDWSGHQAATNGSLALNGPAAGNATVFGGQGNDELYGGQHSGFLVGGPGTDTMRGEQIRLIGGNASLPDGPVPIEDFVPMVSDRNLAEFLVLGNQLEDVDERIENQQSRIRSLGERIDQIKEKGLIADDYVERAEYLYKTVVNIRALSWEILKLLAPAPGLSGTFLLKLKNGVESLDAIAIAWNMLNDTGERTVRELRPLSDLWNTTRELDREARNLAALCEVRLELLEAREMLTDENDDLGSGTDAMKQFKQEVLDIQAEMEEKNRRSLLASHPGRIHIGDGRFGPDTQNAGDFQQESMGSTWTWEFELPASHIAEMASPEWLAIELSGQIIGLDNTRIGTRVEVNGYSVKPIQTPEGQFTIPIRKRFLNEGANKIRFVASKNQNGFDDTEMWGLELRLVE